MDDNLREKFRELREYLEKSPRGTIGRYDWPNVLQDFNLPPDTAFYAEVNGPWVTVDPCELCLFIADKLGLSEADKAEVSAVITLELLEG